RLIFEITQSTRIQDLGRANAAIQRLREAGFKVGLGEFAGASARFGVLQALVVDFVKIDAAYMREVLSDFRASMILKSMCGLCRELSTYTIAETIESREQVDKLRKLGVECGQGKFLGEPVPDIVTPGPAAAPAAKAP